MISLSGISRFYLYRPSVDMRKSFRGLCGIVNNELKRDPVNGDGYVFINKRRTLIKILVWDRTGYVIYYKRLERGTIEIPIPGSNQLSISTLVMMLEGIKLTSIKHRKRYKSGAEIRA